ncbi:MAG: ABC transporter substrate-binding protein, partial [Actinomycetota bacterium]
QIAVFQKVGNLPSQPALYDDAAIKDFKNPFFSDAPVGTIFSETAKNLQPQYLGKKNGPVRVAVENVLRRIDGGKLKGDDAAWQTAVKEAEKASK